MVKAVEDGWMEKRQRLHTGNDVLKDDQSQQCELRLEFFGGASHVTLQGLDAEAQYMLYSLWVTFFMSSLQVRWHKSLLLQPSQPLYPPSAVLAYSYILTSSLFAVLATLQCQSSPASHLRALPNIWRTTFINVTRLLPTVRFLLWVPQIYVRQQNRVPV